MSELVEFKGNCPGNVAKDAKYVVKGDPSAKRRTSIIALTYRTADDEKWHMSTQQHPDLVEMVNRVKTSLGAPPNGAFYINEYHQVVVPSVVDSKYYLAGTYRTPLEFEFEGKSISGRPVSLNGDALVPGATWEGPHAGIPYVLAAGGADIKYSYFSRPNVEKVVKLSKAIGPDGARRVASRILAIKGFLGGRFYVNEFHAMFTPMPAGYDLRYVYLGQLDLGEWFPEPSR